MDRYEGMDAQLTFHGWFGKVFKADFGLTICKWIWFAKCLSDKTTNLCAPLNNHGIFIDIYFWNTILAYNIFSLRSENMYFDNIIKKKISSSIP